MLNRRHLVSALGAAALVTFAPVRESRAAGMQEFAPGAIDAALASGKAVLIDYSASWCSTCARQERVISALRAENPAYDQEIVFIRVDWDTYRRHEVTTSRGVPRRSTLILLKGDDELGRIIAGTSQGQIKGLLDLGLTSAAG